MDSEAKTSTPRYAYTGERLKMFFQRHGITYKQAAADLHIDKNTVGKAVRGGNLNIDIILQICNVYGLQITDFFTAAGSCATAEGTDGKMAAEDGNGYMKRGTQGSQLEALSELMRDGGRKLDALAEIYRQCQDALDAIAVEEEAGL